MQKIGQKHRESHLEKSRFGVKSLAPKKASKPNKKSKTNVSVGNGYSPMDPNTKIECRTKQTSKKGNFHLECSDRSRFETNGQVMSETVMSGKTKPAFKQDYLLDFMVDIHSG